MLTLEREVRELDDALLQASAAAEDAKAAVVRNAKELEQQLDVAARGDRDGPAVGLLPAERVAAATSACSTAVGHRPCDAPAELGDVAGGEDRRVGSCACASSTITPLPDVAARPRARARRSA